MNTFFKEELNAVKAFVFDVDGVFSGHMYLHPSGDLMRSMNTKDGYAVRLATLSNYPVAIITGGKSESLRTRFAGLGIKNIYLDSHNKIEDLHDFMKKNNLKPADILYMGDDLPDYEAMATIGIPTCPADAAEEIKEISKYISHHKGGDGCVRDVVEQVMRAQGKWPQLKKTT